MRRFGGNEVPMFVGADLAGAAGDLAEAPKDAIVHCSAAQGLRCQVAGCAANLTYQSARAALNERRAAPDRARWGKTIAKLRR